MDFHLLMIGTIIVQLCSAFSTLVIDCPCSYNKTENIATCSGRSLTFVPRCVPSDTKQLILAGNKFETIKPNTFRRFAELEILNLDHNLLEHLQDDNFQGLNKLKTLSLAHNRLKYNDSFSENVFLPLRNIQNLNIHGNCDAYVEQNCAYPDVALSKAPSLSNIFLDGFRNVAFGEGFKSLKGLHTLRMDSDIGFCYLGQIPQDMFWNLRGTNISHIEINRCRISQLLPNTFSDLLVLETLIISSNREMRGDGIINATVGLNSPNLKRLSLNDIYTYHENINLPADMFKDIKHSTLEELELAGDRIALIDPACVVNLPKSLKYINISNNMIDDAIFLGNLYKIEKLEVFDISYQSHFTSSNPMDKNNRTDNLLPKRNNSENLSSTPNNQAFKINHLGNLADHLDNETYNLEHLFYKFITNRLNSTGNGGVVLLPRNIKTILMNNIKLEYPVPPLQFGPNQLQVLNMSGCMLKAILGPWYGLKSLEVLDVSHNTFKLINPTSFKGYTKLTSLFLQGNTIGSNMLLDSKCQMFSSQTLLQILDLSDNGLPAIPQCLFESLSNLKWLSLAHNALTTIDFQVDSLLHLQSLDLSFNKITTMAQQTLSALNRLSEGTTISINVQDNRFSCGCKERYFVDWLTSTKVIITNMDNITCTYKNQTKVSLSDRSIIAGKLRDECLSWIVVTACVITFFTLLLVLGFIAVVCHKRGKYMYLFRTVRKTLNPYHKMRNETVHVNIDAYISYDQDYEVFGGMTMHQIIQRHIYPALQRKGLRIQIRENLDGNKLLSSMISEQLQHCHKVVIFLTEEFCKDFANSHEFHVAATEGIYTNRNIIIPVLVGESAWQHLLPEMTSYLQSEDIAYFPTSEDNLGDFIDYLENRILQW